MGGTWDGVPPTRSGWGSTWDGIPPWARDGVPHSPVRTGGTQDAVQNWARVGVFPQPGQNREVSGMGYPLARSRWGYPSARDGVPPLRDRTAYGVWLLRSRRRTLLSIEWNSIRLGGPAHGIVTKTVHKTLPGVGGG